MFNSYRLIIQQQKRGNEYKTRCELDEAGNEIRYSLSFIFHKLRCQKETVKLYRRKRNRCNHGDNSNRSGVGTTKTYKSVVENQCK